MRYLNLLEAQLITASRELRTAATRSPGGARTRLRALVRRHTYLSAALGLVTLTVASGAIAAVSGLLGHPDLSTPSPLGTASSIPSRLASSFAILRRARRSGDALSAGTSVMSVAGGVGAHYGINLDLSRFAGTVDGASVWLVPGSTGTCMYTANGGACGPNELVSTQGIVLMLVPVSGGAVTFIGVVPDGASVTAANIDGTHGTVSRSGAAFSVSADPNLRAVTIHNRDGQDFTLPNPRPATHGSLPPVAPTTAAK